MLSRSDWKDPVPGYTFAPESYYQVIRGWFKGDYVLLLREELAYTPGVVSGIYISRVPY